MMHHQATLPLDLDAWRQSATASAGERGAIFTRREVVEFILDLTGYTADRPLWQLRLLEPAVGQGAFLLPAIDRLLAAWRAGPRAGDIAALRPALCGVEVHEESLAGVRQHVIAHLIGHGLATQDAVQLADVWLIRDDFLLAEIDARFHIVIGNPPYVRQELVPDALMAEYRARFRTIYDRADLYIPFIQKSLTLLEPGGQLGFICSDRWMKNRYGGPLRRMVAEHFHLKTYIDMVDTPAFQTDVIAYPAIVLIERGRGTETRVAYRPTIEANGLTRLAASLTNAEAPADAGVRCIEGVAAGAEPWLLGSVDQLALVRRLEQHFPTIEEAGCTVGIGVATGADKAFIAPFDALDVEPDRKLPLVTTRDIRSGAVHWRGLGVVNPFGADGELVNLGDFPRLSAYLAARKETIAARHIARRSPTNWYRTIDRIDPALAATPKLLIPDIKGAAHIVYESGTLYPHHNLYYLTSTSWDLRALRVVLRAGIARLFVATYSTRMRGGYLRFQAQYLRRIRLPRWHDVPDALKRDLLTAAERDDAAMAHQAVARLYGLSDAERDALGGAALDQAVADEDVGVELSANARHRRRAPHRPLLPPTRANRGRHQLAPRSGTSPTPLRASDKVRRSPGSRPARRRIACGTSTRPRSVTHPVVMSRLDPACPLCTYRLCVQLNYVSMSDKSSGHQLYD
jgi:hypothetical protein